MMNIDKKLLAFLALFHLTVIILANYAVQFTATVAGFDFTWGMFVFPLVILATDLTVRLSGPRPARLIVAIAYIPAIVISAWLTNWRIGIASGTAYLIGQLLDIAVFQKIREPIRGQIQGQIRGQNRGQRRRWWTAPLVSTFCANIIDTSIFFSVAFYRSTDAFMAAHWREIAANDLGFKIVISILVFLPAYGVLLHVLQTRFMHPTRSSSRLSE